MIVAVIGVGLIGGSIGLAARERLGASVRGFDPADGVLERALEHGAVEHACATVAEVVEGADTAFVAAPVGALPAAVGEALAAAGPECVVSDVGSTKRDVVAAHDDPRFVGGHPLAGAETAGVERARADLFEGATWYLTPAATTSGILYERLHRALAGLGARPAAIDAATHDRLLANVSHLPHVLANVLVVPGRRHARGRERAPAGHRPELSRRDPRGRRQRRDLDRHLPLKPRCPGRAARRHRPPAGGRARRPGRRRPGRDRRLERARRATTAARCWRPA